MLPIWMSYSISISLLLLLAAEGLERAAGGRLIPRRMIWLGSMFASCMMSAGALLWPSRELVAPSWDPSYTGEVFRYEVVAIAEPVERAWGSWLAMTAQSVEPVLLAIWIAASAIVLIYAARAGLRLSRMRRGWRMERIGGRDVLVSADTGPAVVGFLRSQIVVPAWVLNGDPQLRDLMLVHEEEHLDAGDPRTLLSALILVAVAPWNLPLWWQLRKLRLAIELDCDARVLRRTADPRTYASLLLDVSLRRSSPFLAVAAFSKKSTFLERRIRMITHPRSHRPPTRIAAGVAALVLLLAACAVDPPTTATPVAADLPGPTSSLLPDVVPEEVAVAEHRPASVAQPAVEPEAREQVSASAAAPADTIPPPPGPGNPGQQTDTQGRLQNIAEVQRNVEAFYPPLLREAGIGGTVQIQLYVTAEGTVAEPRVVRSSGHGPIDIAALRVAGTMTFSPFKFRGENVGVWIELPFTFQPPGGAASPGTVTPGPAADAAPEPNRPLAAGVPPFPGDKPLSTLDRPPALANMSEVQGSLISHYPRLLLDAGISGTVTMRIYIDANGRVAEAYATEATNQAFVTPAETVVRTMHFRPAEDDGAAVGVWVEMPINFSSGGPR